MSKQQTVDLEFIVHGLACDLCQLFTLDTYMPAHRGHADQVRLLCSAVNVGSDSPTVWIQLDRIGTTHLSMAYGPWPQELQHMVDAFRHPGEAAA